MSSHCPSFVSVYYFHTLSLHHTTPPLAPGHELKYSFVKREQIQFIVQGRFGSRFQLHSLLSRSSELRFFWETHLWTECPFRIFFPSPTQLSLSNCFMRLQTSTHIKRQHVCGFLTTKKWRILEVPGCTPICELWSLKLTALQGCR